MQYTQSKREPMLYIAVGKKGIGKTWETIKLIEGYAKGTVPKRVLILDVNDEYRQYKTISIDNVKLFSVHPIKEIRRVTIFKPDGRKCSLREIADLLSQILENYYDGLLLIEDINKYLSDSLPADIVGSIVTQRHHGVDVIIHYQNIGRVGHPKILGNVNILRIHKTTDDAERHKNKFNDSFEIIKIAQLIVNNDYRLANIDKRAPGLLGTFAQDGSYKSGFVYVNLDNNKVSGKFTMQQFFDAVDEYISDNEQTVLRPYLNRRDARGNKLYDFAGAMKACRDNLFREYYGNKMR